MRFSKPSKSIPDQVKLLKQRGMVVGNTQETEIFLKHVSYYRLRAYLVPFEKPGETSGKHFFKVNTKFEDVQVLYDFDRELRLLMLDAIERIEIALRSEWANYMAIQFGPHGYLQETHYADVTKFHSDKRILENEYRRSQDDFTRYYRDNFSTPNLPPVWMATELMSFGTLSKFIKNLNESTRKRIARSFIPEKSHTLNEGVLFSFIHHLCIVRNICAHHGRLWNRKIPVPFGLPRRPRDLSDAISCDNQNGEWVKPYNTLVMINHLLTSIVPDNDWKKRLLN